MYKKVKPEEQGDKVVLREWVGEEPKKYLKGDNINTPPSSRWIEWNNKIINAPAYQHHPDHEAYFRERIGVITDVEIVDFTIQDIDGILPSGQSASQYAIPKQEDDLWEEAKNAVKTWNTMKAPLIEQIQRHDWRLALEVIQTIDAMINRPPETTLHTK